MYKKQQGLTMISWVVVVSFLGVVLVSALNVIPSYLNYFSAKSILDNLAADSSLKGKTPKQIKTTISKHFQMNGLRNIKVRDAITFKNKGASERAGFVVKMKYEDKGKIMGNLYFLTDFDYEVEINP